MNTFTCQACGKDHEVFRRLDIDGRSELRYICHGGKMQTTDKAGNVILKRITLEHKYLGPDLDGPFREVWAPRLAKEVQGKNQLQLLMMHERKRA